MLYDRLTIAETRQAIREAFKRNHIPTAKRGERGVHIVTRTQPLPSIEIKIDYLPGTDPAADTLKAVAGTLYEVGLDFKLVNDAFIRYFFINGRREGADIPEVAGICDECGRILTNPESVKRGRGPDCATKQPFPG